MPVVKRTIIRSTNHQQPNGLYVHFSPPKALSMSSADLRQLIKLGDIDKLEQLVYEGQGKKLVGYQFTSDPKVKDFLKTIPSLMSKISLLHDAVNSGRVEELKALLDEEPEKRKKLVLAKDEAGVGLLHKAVYYDLKDIYRYLIENFPHTVHQRDSEGRTAYHYVSMCRDKKLIQKLLANAGADPTVSDNLQHSARYYLDHKEELELPNINKSNNTSRKSTANKDSLVIKKSNIRIWIHQRNLGHLQRVVWEGQGNQLLVEHSNNPKVRRFLEAVPHIMGLIKDIHCDVQNDDLEALKAHVSPPVPPVVLSAKDSNGLTPLHKAAGLGHLAAAEFIIQKYPNCVAAVDCNGRTALHYAALVKDEGQMFDFLVKVGVDESALDSKQKSAGYYKTRTNELDSKLLHVIPDCPRTSKPLFLASFDWNLLTASTPIEELIKKPENTFGNTTEREHSKPPPEKLKAESNDKLHEYGLNENKVINEIKEEDNNNTNNNYNNKPPVKKLNIKKHIKETKQTSRDRSHSPEKKMRDHDEEIVNPRKEHSPKKPDHKKVSRSPSPQKMNGHPPMDKLKSFEVLEMPEDVRKSTEAKRTLSRQETYSNENNTNHHDHEITSKRAPSRQYDEMDHSKRAPSRQHDEMNNTTRAPSRQYDEINNYARAPSRQHDEMNNSKRASSRQNEENTNRRAPSRQATHERDESPRKMTRNGSSHRYMDSPAPGSEGVIEGIVDGVNEVETLNEQGQEVGEDSDGKEKDMDVNAMVEAGNMEQLAAVVLNGDGDKLVGQHSDNIELQTFLENVPVYMSKINRIHVAAKDGSLRDLQAALDRRKFAIAKDKISPNGASPLHVATIFGNTSIVRYLAGRFPETLQAVDENGRTPLHYAAVLADNGHYYNLMLHLGADSRIEDKFGKTPEYYLQNREMLSHRSLLRDFGTDESQVDEILSDKVPNDTSSARKDFDDEDMLKVLERCYNVLHGRRGSNSISAVSTLTTISSISSHSSIIGKHMKRYVFDIVKYRLTKLDHNLYDLIWPSVKKLPTDVNFRNAMEQDFLAGVVIPDVYCYAVFNEFLEPFVKDLHCIDIAAQLHEHPTSKFVETNEEDKNFVVDIDLDPHAKMIISDALGIGNNQVDMPFFRTEEGRYLASSLGDPLIKGLTEVANKRPEDPIAYLATYLYNFARNRNNNGNNNRAIESRGELKESHQNQINGSSNAPTERKESIPTTIDVVTLDPEENQNEKGSAFSSTTRDEHGQSMLHFAAARAHGRNALFQLLIETEINVGYRDELYRTARDISVQANVPENTLEIDRYVIHIATKGDIDKLVELLLDGYDHIIDIADEDNVPIVEAVSNAEQPETVAFLQSILAFEEKRERVHYAIRQNALDDVKKLLADENDTGSGKLLAIGKNSYGRCTLHIAVLCQQEEIVDYLANTFSETLKVGDNLERTALHYAMGVEKMETISRVLIKAGAERVTKDLKGRQPTYYYMNKSDILRLQEEEETF